MFKLFVFKNDPTRLLQPALAKKRLLQPAASTAGLVKCQYRVPSVCTEIIVGMEYCTMFPLAIGTVKWI
jgi:hypothetical protein